MVEVEAAELSETLEILNCTDPIRLEPETLESCVFLQILNFRESWKGTTDIEFLYFEASIDIEK
jgi:hypothetical protein